MINSNQELGTWRHWNQSRPWYRFALSLIPLKKNEKILELGAGNGEFSLLLKKKYKKVYCVDNSLIYISRLKKLGFKAWCEDLNNKLSFKDSEFDGVCLLEVLEHIPKAELLLQEINRMLKSKGWLLISTPNISWCGYRLLSLAGKLPFKEGYHLRYFNYYSLKKKLFDNSFKIVKQANFSPLPYINRIRQFWLPVRLWSSLLAQDLVFLCRKNE